MRTHLGRAVFVALILVAPAQSALAQDKPAPIVEGLVGRSSFIDEVWDHFTTFGAGARFYVTPRVAIGPEFAYLTGEFEGLDGSNFTVTGNLTYDFVQDDGTSVVPYLVVGGGFIRQTMLVGSGPGSTTLQNFSSSEGTASGGGGVRIPLGSRAFIAPEFRLGFEPTMRVAVMIGFRPGR